MKLVCAFAMMLAAGAATAQQPDQLFTATRQQLDAGKVVLEQEAAWNKGDLDAYLGFYKDAPDTVAMLATTTRGLENIRTAFRTNFPNAAAMGSLEETEVNVRAMGENYTLVTGHYHLTRAKKAGGDTDGTFTEIMERTEKGWRVIFSETA